MSELTPTRSALLELHGERRAMEEGYAFLDEKRLLLAAEMVRQLGAYERLRAEFLARQGEAVEALRRVVTRHGLEGTECLPSASLAQARMVRDETRLLGVVLVSVSIDPVTSVPVDPLARDPNPSPPNPSPEARHCRAAFLRLLAPAAALAAVSGNLERLEREYRRTERRARALEDVLLPELTQAVQQVEAALEDLDREEAVRVRAGAAGRAKDGPP